MFLDTWLNKEKRSSETSCGYVQRCTNLIIATDPPLLTKPARIHSGFGNEISISPTVLIDISLTSFTRFLAPQVPGWRGGALARMKKSNYLERLEFQVEKRQWR